MRTLVGYVGSMYGYELTDLLLGGGR